MQKFIDFIDNSFKTCSKRQSDTSFFSCYWCYCTVPLRSLSLRISLSTVSPGMRFGMSLVAFTICFGVGFAVTMGTAARDSRSKFPMHFQAPAQSVAL